MRQARPRPKTFRSPLLFAASCASALGAAAIVQAAPSTPSPIAPAECRAHVGYNLNAELPGYLIASSDGARRCVPFTATTAKPPAGYRGDYYVDEFTDAKMRAAWAVCKADTACDARLEPHITGRAPPNKDHRTTDPHGLYLLGRVNPDGTGDLTSIRRPAFFGAAPWREPIAQADADTFVVEFTTDRDPYERLTLHLDTPVKLRGWYMRGQGVDDGAGRKVRSLIIMSAGGGGRIVAIEDPTNQLYHMDPKTGRSVLNKLPSAVSGVTGQRAWRRFMYILNQAGFDVLSYDRRGVGLSSGVDDTDTVQQARDVLRVITELKTGDGVRVATPTGQVLEGRAATRAVMTGVDAGRLPVLLMGSSRGTMTSGFAMARNFDKTCEYDMPTVACGPPVGLKNLVGVMQLSDYTAGPGYITYPTDEEDDDRILFEGGTEVQNHIAFFPSSAILASVPKWPALFIGRGLWDFAESLEGAVVAYDRATGLKELVVVRAPHPIETWPEAEQQRVLGRMIAFATAATLGQKTAPGARSWTDSKSLAATTPDLWEPSSEPGKR
ncbi:hypothetical protein [Caulobacter sp. S45]|uniref:hypothetical protein n=1 Tax=Caulobacter sp. S45 TaxID=1641861 RepID=UPI00131B963E|nr:hypothetical protein [Caulobacter sp. S45]